MGGYFLDEGDTALGVVLLAGGVYLGSFIAAYIGVGLAAAVDAATGTARGPRPGPAGGLVSPGAISVWALITRCSAARLGEPRRAGLDSSPRRSAAPGAWSSLAVPAIALENAGPLASLAPASIFKDHWSGQIVGMAAIGGGVFLFVMLPGLVLAGIGFLVLSELGAAGVGGELLDAAGVVVFAIGAVPPPPCGRCSPSCSTAGRPPGKRRRFLRRGPARRRAHRRPPALDAASDAYNWDVSPGRLAVAPPRAPLGARASPRTGIRDLARRPAAASASSAAASAYSSPLAGRRFASVLHLQT